MSNHLLFKRIMSVMLVLALVFSIFPMAVYAEENTATVSFSIDGTSYKVDMKFEDDLLYCRADQWAEAAGCLWVFNSDQQQLLFYYDGPTILASYDDQEYIADGSSMWVPFFDAATQTGVYFSEVSGFTVCGYKVKPLAVFYKDMDRMFGISKYRTSEMIIELGGVWALISSASRAYAILSSLSIEGFLDAVSGKMDQDMYDAVLLDMLKTDETLLGAITGAGEALERPGKIINLLQKSLDEDGALVELLEQMDFSESDIRDIVWDLSQEAYGNKTLNDLSDFYEANKTTHFLEMLGFIDDMTVSLEADIHAVMAMQAVFANSDSAQMRHAAEKAIGARVGNKALTAGMYSLEFLGDVFLDNAIGKLEEAYEKSAGITSLKKLGAEAFVWVLDKSLSMTETTNAIMYSDVYSQVQLELTSYYYRHRADTASDNALMMHSVALLYLRSCLAAWRMFEYDESLSQPISNATTTLTAEITNLMQYTEDELLQNGTSEEVEQAIIDLVHLECDATSQHIIASIEYGILISALDDAGMEKLTWDLADGNSDGVDELYINGQGDMWRFSQLYFDAATDYLWSYTATGAAQSSTWVNFEKKNGYIHQRSYGSAAYQACSYITWDEANLNGFASHVRSWSGSDNTFIDECQWNGEVVPYDTYKTLLQQTAGEITSAEMNNPELLTMEFAESAKKVCAVLDIHFQNRKDLLQMLVQDLDGDGVTEHLYLIDGAANRILDKMDVENALGDERHLSFEDEALTIISVEEQGALTTVKIIRSEHYDLSDGAIHLYDDLVTISKMVCTCNSEEWVFQIPQINLDSSEIDLVNEKIMSDYSELLHDCDNSGTDMYLPYCYVGCNYNVKGDILSLVIEAWPSDCDGSWYSVYNISLSKKVLVDDKTVIEVSGMTESEYRTHVKQALGSEFWNFCGFLSDANPDDYSMDEWFMFDQMLQDTISSENVEAARPFWGENGDLWVVGDVYIPAGGGVMNLTVNLNEYDMAPNYAESLNYDRPEEQMCIELSWDGRNDEDELMYLEAAFTGLMDDGGGIQISEWSFTYNEQGQPIARGVRNWSAGTVTYYLYRLDGRFDFEVSVSEDIADFIGAICESGAKVVVTYPDGRSFTYTLDEGVYKSYTGHWFWAPFSIDHGVLVEYDSSWINYG